MHLSILSYALALIFTAMDHGNHQGVDRNTYMSNDTIFSATEEIASAAWLNGHLVRTVTVFRKALRPHGSVLQNRPEPHLQS